MWAKIFSTFWWWNFDGVIYCLLSRLRMLFFGGEIHIIGLQGKHTVHCWCRHILGRVLENSEGLLTSGSHVGRDDLPDGWHWDKWNFLIVFILTMSVFWDIKHLVVSLFTMAFLRIYVCWDNWKMDSRRALIFNYGGISAPVCLFWFCHQYCLTLPHSKRQSHLNEWITSSRCRQTTKLLEGKFLSITWSLLASKRWQTKPSFYDPLGPWCCHLQLAGLNPV